VITQCPEPFVNTLGGQWDKNTMGDRRYVVKKVDKNDLGKKLETKYEENTRWCCNPQY